MDDIGIDITVAAPWFKHTQDVPYILVQVEDQHATSWPSALRDAIRRCYITDHQLELQSARVLKPKNQVLAAVLPDAGSTMAGDFGEILVYLYHASKAHPQSVIGVKKWRLKQDRTKPAPHSDVVHFILPSWPRSSHNDVIVCSEVKTKSTDGESSPIKDAIKDCEKDRTSRLARTLTWLKERALTGDLLGDLHLDHIERFLDAAKHPHAARRFHAVAVMCASVLAKELPDAPSEKSDQYTLVVIAVPNLQRVYTSVFMEVYSSSPASVPIPPGSAASGT